MANEARLKNQVIQGKQTPLQTGGYDYTNAGSPFPEYDDSSFNIPGAIGPAANEGLKEILKRQLGQAKQFRENIPKASDALFDSANRQAKGQLAAGIASNRKEANKRGKFYSGQRQGQELGLKAQTNSELADARGKINRGLLDQADVLENNAFNTAGNLAGQGPGLGASALSGLASDITAQGKSDEATATAVNGLLKATGSWTPVIYNNLTRKSPAETYNPTGPSYGGYNDMMGSY